MVLESTVITVQGEVLDNGVAAGGGDVVMRVAAAIPNAALRVTRAGRILAWNGRVSASHAWVRDARAGAELAAIAPAAFGNAVREAFAAEGDVGLERFGVQLIRTAGDEALLLFDGGVHAADAFDVTEEHNVAEANRNLIAQIEEAAREWRETFDAIQAPIIIADADGRLRRLNAAALALSRFDDYRSAIGQQITDLGDDAVWSDIDALARTGATHGEAIALQGVDRNGRSWDLLASASRVPGQTIIVASEVTELVRMQERLRRTERMSEMGALVAGVAHEVRNPLFGLSATLDAFEVTFGSSEYQEFVLALREQVERMTELMHELLEYGRPVAAVRQPEDLVQVVMAAISSVGPLARLAGVIVTMESKADYVRVPMDRPRMLQVFENLLKNAIEHSPAGGIVDVNVSREGAEVVVRVDDRGRGFDEADIAHLFEPFFTRRRGGTGLGLSLVRRIVDEHNGTVAATNRPGRGASMIVRLPVV